MFGSGAGFVGDPNMVAYGAAKAFDIIFAEALWGELHDKGVDVLGLILGKTDTPALRRLERELGSTTTEDQPPATPRPSRRSSQRRSTTSTRDRRAWWARTCARTCRC